MTKEQILKEVFAGKVSAVDAFLLFALCHMYELETNAGLLPADTQRGSADCLTFIWPDSGDTDWYWLWNTDWGGYCHFEELTSEEENRLQELKQLLLSHTKVKAVLPDPELED